IKKIKPSRIVYISCDPATLARDLEILKDSFTIEEVQPVDMFSRSFHVETVCGLLLKDSKK
ncbi:MAG: 23S rRNA (uracil-5-)-methyltransferase RumA, partial [Bacilli bacterium]|nr:23S rRNA (uracil-5-)-methyltransferase RumA [Bacilli bacterium]